MSQSPLRERALGSWLGRLARANNRLTGATLTAFIEQLTELPAGTLGFCASDKIGSDEYRQIMKPIYAALPPV